MNILILEDDESRVKVFKSKFSKHQLFITDSAVQAIKYLQNNIFDYIFLDHDLGGKQMQWDEQDCGMLVVDYMCNNLISNKSHVICIIHSYNSPRGIIMKQKLKQAGYLADYMPGVWNYIGEE